MNALTPFNGTAERTMSSLDIAELTGKLHHHVIRDIRRMLEDIGEAATKFGGSYRAADNSERPCYHLPQRECLILASGYDVSLCAKIIDRWIELEIEARQPAPQPVLTTAQQLAQAVLLANTVIQQKDEKIAQLESTVAEQRPLVRVTEARSLIHQRCDSILSD